jgi:hypothetical protein
VVAPPFEDGLAAAGAALWLDMPRQTDGSDQRWHDFSDVDAVLCARRGDPARERRKPGTKLINAWVAGCLPLATHEPGYVELGRHGEDVWFVDAVAEIPAAVAHLNRHPEAVRRLVEGVEQRRDEFAPTRVLGQWRALLEDVRRAPAEPRARSARARARIAAWRLRSFHHGARVRNVVWARSWT